MKLEISECMFVGGRPRRGEEIVLSLRSLCVDAETFEWLGGASLTTKRLVLSLNDSQAFMAFKYARSVTESIELVQPITSESDF